jgi:hypothetical protein
LRVSGKFHYADALDFTVYKDVSRIDTGRSPAGLDFWYLFPTVEFELHHRRQGPVQSSYFSASLRRRFS